MRHILIFILCVCRLVSTGQTNVNRAMVNSKVAELVRMMEEKVPRIIESDSFKSFDSLLELTDSSDTVTMFTVLYFNKDGTKDLWVSLYYWDEGANGWGEDCIVNEYHDCDCVSDDRLKGQFASWAQPTRQKYLNKYYAELIYWEQVLLCIPMN